MERGYFADRLQKKGVARLLTGNDNDLVTGYGTR